MGWCVLTFTTADVRSNAKTEKVRGSISAEHGLGLMKAQHIHFSKSPLAVSLMQTIKKQLDPNGIMNPYKMLPSA